MTGVILLNRLKDFTKETVKDLLLPVSFQKGDAAPPAPRAAEVYCARLPDSRAAAKKAPYVLHQILTRKDIQPAGRLPIATAAVRTIFCVYNPDEQEGGLALLNLMERMRIALWSQGKIGNQFILDREVGLEGLIYPEDTAPYYAGEMVSVWKLPSIERMVSNGEKGHGHIRKDEFDRR